MDTAEPSLYTPDVESEYRVLLGQSLGIPAEQVRLPAAPCHTARPPDRPAVGREPTRRCRTRGPPAAFRKSLLPLPQVALGTTFDVVLDVHVSSLGYGLTDASVNASQVEQVGGRPGGVLGMLWRGRKNRPGQPGLCTAALTCGWGRRPGVQRGPNRSHPAPGWAPPHAVVCSRARARPWQPDGRACRRPPEGARAAPKQQQQQQ